MNDFPSSVHVEDVEMRGHIIDSLLLPKVLDLILEHGGTYRLKQIDVGATRNDPSRVVVGITAATEETLAEILAQISDHGAVPVTGRDCRLATADIPSAFPDDFYSTTNQRTEIRLDGQWVPVDDQEMDCGIRVDPASNRARCIPMLDVQVGDQIVVGYEGVRVFPEDRAEHGHGFEFMSSSVSTEKPKGIAVRQVAAEMFETKSKGGKTLVVGGPAIVHTGSVEHFGQLIRRGYVQKLFAGNALATHDIEQALFGTSLGVSVEHGLPTDAGHEHHLRAINRIRRAGGIRAAVESGLLTSGIMFECVKNDVEVILAGSIRDDGPLPEVITDVIEAQRRMRQSIRDVDYCVMIATMLHSVAVGNLLPAAVQVVCVDINPSTVIKLADRGSFQTRGLVTDVEPFLRALVAELTHLEQQTGAG